MKPEVQEAMNMAREQVEQAVTRRDRSVYVSISYLGGVTISVEPWPAPPEDEG